MPLFTPKDRRSQNARSHIFEFQFHHEYLFVCMWYISFHVLKRREMFPNDLSPKIAPHTYELSEPRVKGRSGLCFDDGAPTPADDVA